MKNRVRFGLIAAITCTIGAASRADLGDQKFKLIPDGMGANGHYGISVAIDGNTAIVGAFTDRQNGFGSGAAHLMDITTGLHLRRLAPDDGMPYDHFGYSVAISGDRAIVGARYHDGFYENSGAAYIFDTRTGEQLLKLEPEFGYADAEFGWSVGISGSIAIVGAIGEYSFGERSGAVYVFDAETGERLDVLHPPVFSDYAEFGYSVAIRGSHMIVGAWHEVTDGVRTGGAYLYDLSTGDRPIHLMPYGPSDARQFGKSVGISDSIAIVGASRSAYDRAGEGAAYIFDLETAEQLAMLVPPDDPAVTDFGRAVAINEHTALVTSRYNSDETGSIGAAYLFTKGSGFRPRQVASLIGRDTQPNEGFGVSAALNEGTALVGSFSDNLLPIYDIGSAYLFEASDPALDADLNNDGIVDAADLGILIDVFGRTTN